MTRDEHMRASLPVKQVHLLEPCARDMALAVAAAFHVRAQFGESARLLVLPADHVIAGEPAFAVAVTQASRLADERLLVTFGIVPASAETSYSDIECGERCSVKDVYRVTHFVGKPTLELAQQFVASGWASHPQMCS